MPRRNTAPMQQSAAPALNPALASSTQDCRLACRTGCRRFRGRPLMLSFGSRLRRSIRSRTRRPHQDRRPDPAALRRCPQPGVYLRDRLPGAGPDDRRHRLLPPASSTCRPPTSVARPRRYRPPRASHNMPPALPRTRRRLHCAPQYVAAVLAGRLLYTAGRRRLTVVMRRAGLRRHRGRASAMATSRRPGDPPRRCRALRVTRGHGRAADQPRPGSVVHGLSSRAL